LASSDGRDDSLAIRQEASLLATVPDEDAALPYHPQPGRQQYLHLARGTANLNGIAMRSGDGAFIENEILLTLSDAKGAEALLFDLP
jgi:quercetin 2,3-dioxygenase